MIWSNLGLWVLWMWFFQTLGQRLQGLLTYQLAFEIDFERVLILTHDQGRVGEDRRSRLEVQESSWTGDAEVQLLPFQKVENDNVMSAEAKMLKAMTQNVRWNKKVG